MSRCSTPRRANETYAAGLLEYFRLEHLYETKQFQSLSRDRLIRLKRARRLFNSPDTQSLFDSGKRMAIVRSPKGSRIAELTVSDFCGLSNLLAWSTTMTFSTALTGAESLLAPPRRSTTCLHQGFDRRFHRSFTRSIRPKPRIINTLRNRVASLWALRGVVGWAGATPVIGRLRRPDLNSSPEGSARVAPAHPTTHYSVGQASLLAS